MRSSACALVLEKEFGGGGGGGSEVEAERERGRRGAKESFFLFFEFFFISISLRPFCSTLKKREEELTRFSLFPFFFQHAQRHALARATGPVCHEGVFWEKRALTRAERAKK